MKIHVELQIPPWVRNGALIVASVALLMAAFVVHADVPNSFKSGDALKAQQLNDNFIAIDNRLKSVESTPGLPAGTIVAFGGPVVPAGWLPCNGAEVKRSEYPALFSAIGTAHGSGDGATTFALPDYGGRFLRGVDGQSARDPDRASRVAAKPGGNVGNLVGSVQDDQFAGHVHNVKDMGHSHTGGSRCNGQNLASGPVLYLVDNFPCNGPSTTATGNAKISEDKGGGGSETRPVNAYVNFVIKY
jgi:microcystin-dependent protein